MRPEEVSSREARIVLEADEIEKLGALALKAGDESLAQSLTDMRAEMQQMEDEGRMRFIRPLPQKPVTARDIIGDERMDKVIEQQEKERIAAAKGRAALTKKRRRRITWY